MRKFKNEGTDNVLAQCSRCLDFLPLNDYHKHNGRKYNIKSYCIGCGNKTYTPEHKREVRKAWEDRTDHNAKRRAQYDSKARRLRTVEDYGLTLEEFDEIAESQGHKCAICLRSFEFVKISIDHCHDTGAVRGLLCTSCNTAIGKLQDDPEIVTRAADYLMAAKARGHL